MARKEQQVSEDGPPAAPGNTRFVVAAGLVVAIAVGGWYLYHRSGNMTRSREPASAGPAFTRQGRLTFRDPKGTERLTIDIEIAEDEYKREIGLMDRASIGELEGMLFVFPVERDLSFWMKNTIIPLDMIFVNNRNLIVTIQHNARPFSEESYSSTAPCLYVIEVNAGFADRHGINVGDSISWSRN